VQLCKTCGEQPSILVSKIPIPTLLPKVLTYRLFNCLGLPCASLMSEVVLFVHKCLCIARLPDNMANWALVL
jgi:hypothetical protein